MRETLWIRLRFESGGRVLIGATVMLSLMTGTVQAQQARRGSENVTFTKDVAPILQKACQNCHRPDSLAPMSLLTYQETRPWARSIKQKVAGREMPPWFIDRTLGIQKFKNDWSLTDDEIQSIVAWVDAGAPEGNPSDMPAPKVFADLDKWQMGNPDLIVPIPETWTVPVTGPDQWPDLYSDSGLTEDRYIKAVEFKPGSRAGHRVIHHAHQYLIPPGLERESDAVGSFGGAQTLNEYSVGKGADTFPDGTARLMKAGTKVHFNIHYHSIGEEIKDRAAVGFLLYPKGYKPTHVIQTTSVGARQSLDIPANGISRSDGYRYFTKPVKLMSFQPHMHDRGTRECLEVIYPNSQAEVLNCATFNFGWAISYEYDESAAPILPAGSVLHVINWHDNTASNRANPDPRNWAGDGVRTIDEMSHSWINFFEVTPEEYGQEVKTRRARRNAASTQNQQ